MSFSTSRQLLGSAAAAAAIGILITAVPAQAYPVVPLAPNDCAGYQFPGGQVTLHYPNIGETKFDTVLGGTHVDTKATTFYPNGTSMTGSVIGDINGRQIHLEVTRTGTNREYTPLILDGAVGDDNRGHGGYTFRDGADSGSWDSLTEFKCAASAAPPPAATKSATVIGGDADVFNIAHNDVPDPANGVVGAKIATLPDGTQVDLDGLCKAGWCRVNSPQVPQGFGFIEQGHWQIGQSR
jgi:hypothetical protein